MVTLRKISCLLASVQMSTCLFLPPFWGKFTYSNKPLNAFSSFFEHLSFPQKWGGGRSVGYLLPTPPPAK